MIYKTVNQLNKAEQKIFYDYIDNFYATTSEVFENRNALPNSDYSSYREMKKTIYYLVINDFVFTDCCREALIDARLDIQESAEKLFSCIKELDVIFWVREN